MRISALTLLLTLALSTAAQVELDGPLRFTAADSALRQVEGLGTAQAEEDLITLDAARRGALHWASTGGTASAMTLTARPTATAYRNGLRLRFIPSTSSVASTTLNVDGLGAAPLVGGDGRAPLPGALQAGRLAEVVWTDTAFLLLPRPADGCPVGYLQVNDGLCMQQDDGANVSVFTAVRQCADQGARLCTWDEYLHACTVLGGQLTDLFNDWEWIDDTSDHTHTANQAGRYYCAQQRAIGAVEHPNNYGRVRCCHRIR